MTESSMQFDKWLLQLPARLHIGYHGLRDRIRTLFRCERCGQDWAEWIVQENRDA